ncbi:hypothetical protein ACFE04_017700 [Oxalis oulophora]
MSLNFSLTLLLISISIFILSPSAAVAVASRRPIHSDEPQDLIHTSCIHASYPTICLRTLSSYSTSVSTPRDVAQVAVRVSLRRAQKVSDYLATIAPAKGKRERAALSDCVEQISETVDELSRTLGELRHLNGNRGGESFRWQMSNAETWVSAALTNEDSCLDGFEDLEIGGVGSSSSSKKVKSDVKRKIGNVARVTSNALYLINKLA